VILNQFGRVGNPLYAIGPFPIALSGTRSSGLCSEKLPLNSVLLNDKVLVHFEG
jgi:hypothetical protein